MARVLVPLALGSALAVTATAAALPPAARTEVDGLMARLETSGCEFSRNGKWYTGADAKSHLLRKLQYLENHNAVQSAEQFIDRAATGSSVSGKPYLVKCGNGAPVASATWLRSQLQEVRKSIPAKGAP
jgi:hypothetical protein